MKKSITMGPYVFLDSTDTEAKRELRIDIRNNSWFKTHFSVTAIITGQRNPWWDAKMTAMRAGAFTVPWTDAPSVRREIEPGRSASLTFAELLPYGETNVSTISIVRFSRDIAKAAFINERVDGATPPEWDVTIAVHRYWKRWRWVALTQKFTLIGDVVNGKPSARLEPR